LDAKGDYMEANQKVNEAVEWYSKNRFIYEALANRVESIVREILESQEINYHSISSRAKSIESYKDKAFKEKYKEPRSEIMDMAGIRVITYTDSDAKYVLKIIKDTFEIHPKLSIDKTEELGVNRVGYRSIHCIGTLGNDRLKLPENRMFKDICFEIQIRTILQHAWAEFEHDRNYKFKGVLPKDMRRRLSILAGNLETVDREFDNIAKEIDAYALDVGKRMKKGDLSISIDSTSLRAYLNEKFKTLVEKQIIAPTFRGGDDDIIEELSIMQIDTLEKLDDVIPKDYAEKAEIAYLEFKKKEARLMSFTGLMRDFFMIHDADTYFKKAWNEKWQGIDNDSISLIHSYGVDLQEYIKKYNLRVH
jgi:ppGpp synthetase/RelA/SpoT-type nucleotidyltranferase